MSDPDAFVEQTARIEAEAHAELRTQFALALVTSGHHLSVTDASVFPPRPMNAAEWARAVYVTAGALAAENARLRKAEGL